VIIVARVARPPPRGVGLLLRGVGPTRRSVVYAPPVAHSSASLTSAPEGLSARERGVLLGSVLFAADAAGPVRGLGGPWAERCAKARRTLDARPEPERRRVVQQLVQQLGWPLPDHVEDLPPQELAALLEAWPSLVAAAICALLPRALQRELSRFAGPHRLSPALQHALAAHVLAPLGRREAAATGTSPATPAAAQAASSEPAGQGQGPRRGPQ
jgi:hypothetical protein